MTVLLCSPVHGDLLINELSATQTDRLLVREAGEYPRVGNTVGWQVAGYDDSNWDSGVGPFGFGVSGVTYGSNVSLKMQGQASGLYLRKDFNVSASDAASSSIPSTGGQLQ